MRGLFLGMDLKAGDPRGCLVESGWAKHELSWTTRGAQAFRGQALVPQPGLQGVEGLGGAVSGSAGSPACLGTVRRPWHYCPWAALNFLDDFLADQQRDSVG